MRNFFLTTFGKTISFISKRVNLGSGSTWPGHIALLYNPRFIKDMLQNSRTQIILIAGTNGKTTTGKILTTILEKNKKKVFQNNSGANLLSGIASTMLLHTNIQNKLTADYAVFEVDENNLPLVLQQLTPKAIILLDLFRDQLDRYGELDSIAKKWEVAFKNLPQSTNLILNADDPLIAYLSTNTKATVTFFGLDAQKEEGQRLQHAADSLYCPRCGTKLHFSKIFYAHLGIWKCPHCKLERPKPHVAQSFYPLDGTYNKYNTLAAVTAAEALGIDKEHIQSSLKQVTAAFGRQEKIIVTGKHVQLFLAKNPTSFNESLRTIQKKQAKHVVFLLNDRIPDGTDISWIWDIDFEEYAQSFSQITISGDRTYDMALRILYAEKGASKNMAKKCEIEPNLSLALQKALTNLPASEILYILPTYSAMLEVRKILTGRKIL